MPSFHVSLELILRLEFLETAEVLTKRKKNIKDKYVHMYAFYACISRSIVFETVKHPIGNNQVKRTPHISICSRCEVSCIICTCIIPIKKIFHIVLF